MILSAFCCVAMPPCCQMDFCVVGTSLRPLQLTFFISITHTQELQLNFYQKNSRRLWRSRRRKSRSVPAGVANFPAAFFLAGKCQALAGIAFHAAGKSANDFPAASKFARKLFQQGISDSHSLLEFSDFRRCENYCVLFV